MEVIQLPGYTHHEKKMIAEIHLVPRQVTEHGLSDEQFALEEDALNYVISRYTREAGVRKLERRIGDLCRGVAVEVVEETFKDANVNVERVQKYLGPERHEPESAERTEVSGVATGMAWTPTGGDILFVEATQIPGTGKLRLTGKLGDVMKESAEIAMSLVKARLDALGIDVKSLKDQDLHVHVPGGAIPKDGPSAGITMFTALVSLLTDVKVRGDVSMTGEATLRGLVLPVGGVKEKVLAAMRAGITEIILPERNRKDLHDIPDEMKEQLKFHFVKKVDEALDIALEKKLKKAKKKTRGRSSSSSSTPSSSVN
jgi:ATP-dependent Lon protease